MAGRLLVAGCWLLVTGLCYASDSFKDAFEAEFRPAQWHRGLETAEAPLDSKKLNGFVEVLCEGIPAEKADWFIGYENYEWRGAYITGDSISTSRRDKPYTYLKPGDVMAVAAVEYQLGKVYMKLISPEVYVPAGKRGRHPTRVTTMLSLDINDQTMPTIKRWVRPVSREQGAVSREQGAVSSEQSRATLARRSPDLPAGRQADVGTKAGVTSHACPPKPWRRRESLITGYEPRVGARLAEPPSQFATIGEPVKQRPRRRVLVEGMSTKEVEEVAGNPLNIVEEKYKTVYQYPGFDVIFKYGQMKDVAIKN